MSEITPLIYDHSSGKSILTFWGAKDTKEGGAPSLIKLCADSGVKSLFLVSDNFSRFPEALKNTKAAGIEMKFGLEVWLCDDAAQKTPASVLNEHKVIIRMDNDDGYHDLIKIISAILTNPDHFYYHHRFDLVQLARLWTPNLSLILPFYDSFLGRNLLTTAQIVPTWPAPPILLREVDGGLPFDPLIDAALDAYNASGALSEMRVKTVMYQKRSQARSWMILRAIKNRASFQKPNLDFCCSDAFSWEDYLSLRTPATT